MSLIETFDVRVGLKIIVNSRYVKCIRAAQSGDWSGTKSVIVLADSTEISTNIEIDDIVEMLRSAA